MKKSQPVIASERNYIIEKEKFVPVSEYYGEDTFSNKVMKEKLPKDTYKKFMEAINEDKILDIATAAHCSTRNSRRSCFKTKRAWMDWCA